MQVGFEVSDYALDLPFDGDAGDGAGGTNRVTAALGHLLASATWPSTATDSGSSVEPRIFRGERPSMLRLEALVSSATVKLEPEGFDLLEAVHVRAVGVIPVAAEIGVAVVSREGSRGGGGGEAPHDDRDELAEKLTEKSSRGPALTLLLPRRPSLRREGGGAGDRDSSVTECAQIRVAVSPVCIKLAEPHILGLACFAMGASTRLAEISEILVPPPSQTLSEDSSVGAAGDADRGGDSGDIGRATDGRSQVPSSLPSSRVDRVESSTKEGPSGLTLPVQPERPAGMTVESRNFQHIIDVPSPSHQGAGRLLPGSGLGDTVLGGQESLVPSSDAPPKAPALPAFLGTLVVDGVNVLLLTDSNQAGSCTETTGGASKNARVSGVQKQPRTRGAPLSTACPRPRACTGPESSGRDPSMAAPLDQLYSPVVFLEVRGIGVGVDLARPPPAASEQSAAAAGIAIVPPVVERGGADYQHRVEIAIKTISLTDVNELRQGSLVRLLCDGSPVGDAETSEVSSGGKWDDARILPAGWWHRDSDEDMHEYGEQVMCRASVCPASKTMYVNADLTSAHIMLLPVPILSVFGMAADVNHDFARYSFSRATERRPAGDSRAGGGTVHALQGARGRCDGDNTNLLSNAASTPSGDAYRLEPWMLRSDDHRSDPVTRNRNERGTIPPALSLPWEVVSGRADVEQARGGDSGACQCDGDEVSAEARRDWRKVVRSLGGATLSDLLWLEQVEASVSASDIQVWLPDSSGAAGVPVAQGTLNGGAPAASGPGFATGNGLRDVEAVVASFGHCHVTLSVAMSLLSDIAASDLVEEVAAADASPIEPSDVRLATSALGDSPGSHSPDFPAGSATGHDQVEGCAARVAPVDAGGRCDELCALRLGVSALEVFVARPSIAEFGVPVHLPMAFAADLAAERGNGDVSANSSGTLCPDALPQELPESAGDLLNAARVPDISRVPSARGLASSDTLQAVQRRRNGGLPGVVTISGDEEADALTQVDEMRWGVRSGRGSGGGAGDSEQGSTRTECIVCPFSVDVSHVLLARPVSQVSSAPPLLSDVVVSVSAIHVVCFLDFPLAARIAENSVGPLLEGFPASAENQSFGSDIHLTRHSGDGEYSNTASRREGVSTEENGTGAAAMAYTVDSPARGIGVAPLASVTLEDLAAMWSGRVGLKVEGLDLTAVNNFYRQNRPFVKIHVSPRCFPAPRSHSFGLQSVKHWKPLWTAFAP